MAIKLCDTGLSVTTLALKKSSNSSMNYVAAAEIITLGGHVTMLIF